jgi:hypothetical protein
VQEDLQLRLQLDVTDGTPEEIDRLTRLLRSELLALDVQHVDLPADEGPEYAKGFGLAEIGSLVVSVATGGAAGPVLDLIRAWIGRGDGRTAKLVVDGNSIELTGLSRKQQQQLIDNWLSHTQQSPGQRG